MLKQIVRDIYCYLITMIHTDYQINIKVSIKIKITYKQLVLAR